MEKQALFLVEKVIYMFGFPYLCDVLVCKWKSDLLDIWMEIKDMAISYVNGVWMGTSFINGGFSIDMFDYQSVPVFSVMFAEFTVFDGRTWTSISGWWFGTCYIFPYIGNNHPIWLIFFRGVGQPPTRSLQTSCKIRAPNKKAQDR